MCWEQEPAVLNGWVPTPFPIPPQKLLVRPKVDRSPDEYPTIPSAPDSWEQIPPSKVTPRIQELRKRFRPWSSNPKASPRGALSAIIARNLGLWSSSRAWWVWRLLKPRDLKRKKTPTTIIAWFFNFVFGVVAEKDFLIVFCCRGRAQTHAHTFCVLQKFWLQRVLCVLLWELHFGIWVL